MPSWGKRKAYSLFELDKLLHASNGATRLIVLLGAHAGLRASEMAELAWEDVLMAGAGPPAYTDGVKRAGLLPAGTPPLWHRRCKRENQIPQSAHQALLIVQRTFS